MTKKDIYAALEQAGHKLRLNKDGEVDEWAYDHNIHNGPECELCGQSWCQHCLRRNLLIKPCQTKTK